MLEAKVSRFCWLQFLKCHDLLLFITFMIVKAFALQISRYQFLVWETVIKIFNLCSAVFQLLWKWPHSFYAFNLLQLHQYMPLNPLSNSTSHRCSKKVKQTKWLSKSASRVSHFTKGFLKVSCSLLSCLIYFSFWQPAFWHILTFLGVA